MIGSLGLTRREFGHSLGPTLDPGAYELLFFRRERLLWRHLIIDHPSPEQALVELSWTDKTAIFAPACQSLWRGQIELRLSLRRPVTFDASRLQERQDL